MLAIAAPTFNQRSETFVRDHVRMLAPGETILLGRADDATPPRRWDAMVTPKYMNMDSLHAAKIGVYGAVVA